MSLIMNDITSALFGAALSLGVILFVFGNVFSPQWACNHIEVTTVKCDIAMGAR